MQTNEYIVSAALSIDDFIVTKPAPARHHHLIQCAFTWGGRELTTWARAKQGFLTNRGRFVDRVEGMTIARNAKQYGRGNTYTGEELFSEDLW